MQVAAAKSGDPKQKSEFKNIPRIGKLPYGAKRGFMERKGLLKERLHLKKGFIESKALLKEMLY